VAQYFACNSAFGDIRDGIASRPVVIVVDGTALLGAEYELHSYSDNFWGHREGDWENEIVCLEDIDPFSEFLVGTEPVPDDVQTAFDSVAYKAFRTPKPRTSPLALIVMEDLTTRVVDADISERRARSVVRAWNRFDAMLDAVYRARKLTR
jgi:hypothetical protein